MDRKLVPHHAHWGAFNAVVEDGKVIGVLPFDFDPDPSPLIEAIPDAVHSPTRVARPMVRAGWLENRLANGAGRGREPFVPVKWEEALRLVADELARVRREHGPVAIMGGSQGWSSAGHFHEARGQLRRFLAACGGFVDQTSNYSFGTALTFLPHILGSAQAVTGPVTSWSSIAGHTRLFVLFGGANPKNTQVAKGGCAWHGTSGAFAALARAGVRVVNISPIREDGPEAASPEWIPIRPNTDTAMMLALAHTLVSERRHDEAFLARCCTGFSRVLPYLKGDVDGQPKDAAWAAAITDVPAETIRALARHMAAARTMLTASWSLQRADHGEQPYWALVLLAACLGQIGLPGGGFGFGYGSGAGLAEPPLLFPGPAMPTLPNPARLAIPAARIADCLLHPGEHYDYDGKSASYPDIRLVYWAGGNPFHHHQDLNRLRRAWQRPETIIVHEPWWTATARHADIVLPATTSLERNDLGGSPRDRFVIAMHKAIEPVGEAWHDFDIFRDLAKRLGCEAAFAEGRDETAWLRAIYGAFRERAQSNLVPEFDAFWERGWVEIPRRTEEYVLFAEFRADPAKNRLRTPSGRIELYSGEIAGFGYDDCPPHPAWIEPAEWLSGRHAAAFPLHLVSSQPRHKLHSQMDAGPVSARGKTAGRETLAINPVDAKARGIGNGEVVRVFNARGACFAGILITEAVRPGVVRLSCGAWYDPADDDEKPVCAHGNANVLTRDPRYVAAEPGSEFGYGTCRSGEVDKPAARQGVCAGAAEGRCRPKGGRRRMSSSHIGRSLPRLEDHRFLTGQGRYVDDVAVLGQLHGVVLRSPHGHALIEGIDTAVARAMPGVSGVFTAADLDADGVGTLPCIARVATVAPMIVPPRRALVRDRARHVGDPVAFVVADTVPQAWDAAERVAVTYRPLPAVVDARAALAAEAPLLWDEAPGNLSYRFERGDRPGVEAAFATAAQIVEIELVNNRLVVAPIEPRAAIGTYDAAADRFDLLLTGQGVHSLRRQLAEAVFNMPPDRITVRAPDVGGGFGVKNFLYPEWVLVLWAARQLGRPVKWIAERGEEFISSAQGRDNHTRARLALDRDGRFLALNVDTVANLGAYLSTNGPGSSTNSPASAMGGVYDIPAVFMAVRGVFTNTLPIDAYRGAGKPEANYLIERLVDHAARRLGADPIALRQRNLISRFPYRSGLGVTIDCGRFAANLDEMAQRLLTDGFAARQAAAAERGRLRGLGTACFLETSRGTPGERAEIRFEPDGRIALVLGTQSNGQGHETSFAQIAADLLGLPFAAFRFVQADTRAVKSGNGHGGARSMHMGGTALSLAAQMVLSKARAIAAHLLQADASEVSFGTGRFAVGGSERGIGLLALAEAARDPANLPDGMSPGLDADAYNDSDVFTFPNGCHAAEIEIDPETGAVTLERYLAIDDYGRLINPMLTKGQVQGGVAQGIGQALLEHTVYEEQSGQLLSGSFLDYALPRADDLPPLEITLAELPTAVNPLGVKGAGQAGCMAAPQTIINAILDALAPLGIAHIDMPATPERIWRAIRSARRADQGRRPEATR